jgi:type IV secretion system protein VirB4
MNIEAESDISQFVPYSTHVHANVVKTRGGDYLVCWYLQGIPFVGKQDEDLEHKHNTFNKLIQVIRAPDYSNVSYWVHDVRRRRDINLEGKFKSNFNQTLNDWYYQQLNGTNVLTNELYLTMIYRPNEGGAKVLSAIKTSNEEIEREQTAQIQKVLELADNMQSALDEYLPYRLGTYTASNGIVFSELLRFLGYILNHSDDVVPVLPARIYNYLPTSRHIFNEKNGNHLIQTANGVDYFGCMLTVKEFPNGTYPGILNNLKYVDFEYIITHSFSPTGKHDALKQLERTKSRMLVTEDKALSQIVELDLAMDGVASGNFILGQYHFTVAIYSKSLNDLEKNIPEIRSVLSNSGFISAREDTASIASFYAQLPCNWKYRTRKAYVSSLNFLGLSPLHNFSSGKKYNNPWGDAVTVLQTNNGQPYYFNFHATKANELSLGEKALGNTMVIGKSGTGKTALINFLLSQVQKYNPVPTIFFFDKDRGAEIFVRACGGRYVTIETGLPTGFNPLQCEKNESNIMYLIELIKSLAQKSEYTASEDDDILRAVEAMLDTPMHLRNMTNLQSSLPNLGNDSVYARLKKWTSSGFLGWVFDNPKDQITFEGASIIGFDYTDLIDMPEIRVPVIGYLIHRMEELIDGRRFIYVMDEFWKILDGEGGLKEFARNKLKTIRKQNGLGIFATQSPEDALKSNISASLVEQTATLILLPNPSADRKDYVEGLKLTDAEFDTVKALDERSRHFLVKQGHESAICQLQLGGKPEVLYVISSSTDNIAIMDQVIQKHTSVNCNDSSMSTQNHPSDKIASSDLWLTQFYDEINNRKKQIFKPNVNNSINTIQ